MSSFKVYFQTAFLVLCWTSCRASSTSSSSACLTVNEYLKASHSFEELLKIGHLNSAAMSAVLPQLVSERYAGNPSNFLALINFIETLPTSEDRIVSFEALYHTIHQFPQLPPASQLVKFAESVKRLNEYVGPSLQSRLENLMDDVRPLIVIGEAADCSITNVAYNLQIITEDWGYPQSAYLAKTRGGKTWRVYQNQTSSNSKELSFRIRTSSGFFLYAADVNSNSGASDKIYQTKPSERYVLKDGYDKAVKEQSSGVEMDWKLEAVRDKPDTFRILTAKSNDVMFAHQSATGLGGKQRVLLGRENSTSHDFVPEADLWNFKCSPGRLDKYNV